MAQTNALQKDYKYTVWVFIILFIAALIMSMLPIYAYCNQFNLYKYSDYWVHNIYAQALRARDFADIYGNYSAYQHLLLYPLYHVAVAFISVFTGSIGSACVVFLALCNIATVLLIRYYARLLAPPDSAAAAYLIDVAAAFSLLFFCICAPFLTDTVILRQGSPNMFHNPTILTVRPIAIFCFFHFIKALRAIRDNAPRGEIKRIVILFAASLAVSVLAKPSFAIVFLFGAGVTTLIKILKDFKTEWKRTGLVMLAAVAPSIAIMSVQIILMPSSTRSLLFSGFPPLNAILSLSNLKYTISVLLLPIIYFVCGGFRQLVRSDTYTCAFFQMLFAWFVWFCTNPAHYLRSDYIWSYSIAAFFITVISLLSALKRSRSTALKAALFAVYGIQVCYGVAYILHVWRDGIFAYAV